MSKDLFGVKHATALEVIRKTLEKQDYGWMTAVTLISSERNKFQETYVLRILATKAVVTYRVTLKVRQTNNGFPFVLAEVAEGPSFVNNRATFNIAGDGTMESA